MDVESRDRQPTPASHDLETIVPDGTVSSSAGDGTLERGATLGRYVLLGRLGSGGMGVVYAAYDPELDRKIAIKLVRDDRGGIEGRARLQREAQALAKVTHPNIAAVFDVGAHGDAVFVAMEFIDGDTLAAWEHRTGGPIPWRDAVAVYAQAGRGLAAAHAAGIVHRDFKPHNVMIDRDGRVVVLDFGLARPATDATTRTLGSGSSWSALASDELTAVGSLIGTPAFMSPEQFAGGATDAASDQFSFCVALWRAVFDQPPFVGATVAELAASVLNHELEAPPRGVHVPPAIRDALHRGLAREPRDRHPSMIALVESLQRDPNRSRRRFGMAAVAAAALGGALWAGQRAGDEDPCAAPAERLAEAWGDARHREVADAFRADAKDYSEGTLARIEGAIDEVTAQWWTARHTVCRGRESTTTALARARCLDDQIERVDAITRVLASADQRMVGRAPAVLRLLPRPEVCEDADAAHDTAPLPDDPALQERVEALRAHSYVAMAMVELGEIDEALASVTTAYDEAVALDFAPLVAEAALDLGAVLMQTQRYDEALAMLEQASLAGRSLGHDDVVLGSALHLGFLHTQHTRKYDLALWLVRDAEALAQRFPDRPRLPPELALMRARLALARGDLDVGVRAAQDAVALLEPLPREGLLLSIAFEVLARLHLAREDDAAADEAFARGATAAALALGSSHPLHADFLLGRAQLAATRGHTRDAIDLLRRAIAIYEGAHGPLSLSAAAARNGLGLVLEADGQRELAADAFARAIAVHRDRGTAGHPQMVIIASNAGNVLRRLGRADESIPLHREAIAIVEASAGADDDRALSARENLADDLRVLGRCAEAESEYRSVIETRERLADPSPSASAYAWVGLGLCRLAAGATEDAITLLQRATGQHAADDRCDEEAGAASFALAIAQRRAGHAPRDVDAAVATARTCFAGPPPDAAALAELDRFVAGEAIAMPTY